MTLLAFATFDEVAGVFGSPVFCANKGLAVRAFQDACAQKSSPLYSHASDYKLYHIGEFDTVTGALTSCPQPVFMHNAVEFKEVGNG